MMGMRLVISTEYVLGSDTSLPEVVLMFIE